MRLTYRNVPTRVPGQGGLGQAHHGLRCAAMLSAALCLFAPLAAQAQGEPPASSVLVSEVQALAIVPTVPVSATVYSRNDVQITVGIDGQLTYVAEPGTYVKKGEVLASIDEGPLKLQLTEQRALAKRADAQLTFLNSQLIRQRSLAKTDDLSANQVEETVSNRDVAASDRAIAQARLRQIEDQIARSVVRAAFNGVVVERMRREGEDVGRGTVVARITDIEQLEVRAFVPLKYAGRVVAGDELTLFGYESRHTGTIRTLIPAADPRSQTFEVRIDLPSSDDATSGWTVGQLVSVSVPIKAATAGLAVPRDALILRQDGTYVFRIDQDNLAQRVAVSLGDSQGDMVAVTGDLDAGDRIAIRGGESLRDGQTVTIVASPVASTSAAAP